jgi:glutathione S-transferase
MALNLAGIPVEIREISLREKPQHMLEVSPKGTVPVLILPDGIVIDESLDIMRFALNAHALTANLHEASGALIFENDKDFKRALDAYKYPEKHKNKVQAAHRADGEVFLQKLENLLEKHTYLFDDIPGFADIAIFPFVRQFAAVDPDWWLTAPYPKCQLWLENWLESDLFNAVMEKKPNYIS